MPVILLLAQFSLETKLLRAIVPKHTKQTKG